jgi:hypothetical protein
MFWCAVCFDDVKYQDISIDSFLITCCVCEIASNQRRKRQQEGRQRVVKGGNVRKVVEEGAPRRGELEPRQPSRRGEGASMSDRTDE